MENKILEILHDKQGRVKKNEIYTLLKSMHDDYFEVQKHFGKSLKNLAYNDLIEQQGDFIILTPKGKKIRTLEELQVYENEQERKEKLKEANDIASLSNNLLTPILSIAALAVSIYSIVGNNTETKELKSKIEHLEQEVKQLKQPKTQKKHQPSQKDKNTSNQK
nr:MAG TPA: cell division protein [Caudoviricetes sp.]